VNPLDNVTGIALFRTAESCQDLFRPNDNKQEVMIAKQQKQIEALTMTKQKVSDQPGASKATSQLLVNNQ
jgi:hypothetical protein